MKRFLCVLIYSASTFFTQAQPHQRPDFTISAKNTKPIAAIAYSPDGQSFAAAESDNEIRVYDAARPDGELSRNLSGHQAFVVALAFKDNSTLVSVSLDQTVKSWNVSSSEMLHSREFNFGKQFIPAFAPGNRPVLVVASFDRVKLWNYQSGALLGTFEANDSDVSTLSFTPDAKRLVIGTAKGVIRVMDVAAWKVARLIDLDTPIQALAASGDRIAVGYADGTIDLLRLGEQASVPEIKAHEGAVSSLAFSPKGDRFASGSLDGMVKLWDSNTRNLLCTLEGRSTKVLSIVFSPNGQKVLAAGADGKIDCWTIR